MNELAINKIPTQIVVSGLSAAGALLGLTIAKSAQIETAKPVILTAFVGTILGVYLTKNRIN